MSGLNKDDIIRMAKQICDVSKDKNGNIEYELDSYGLIAFANLVAAAEREACAKVCENWTRIPETTGMELTLAAAAIRARG